MEGFIDVGKEFEAWEVVSAGGGDFGLDGLKDGVDVGEGFAVAEVGNEESLTVIDRGAVEDCGLVGRGQAVAFVFPQGDFPVYDAAPGVHAGEFGLDDVELGALPSGLLGAEAVALVVFSAVVDPAFGWDLAGADLVAAEDVGDDFAVVA